ncbi:hypothetical protein HPB52_007477 [Rhipicephalus sanguineus]|uniref:Uncharacterized protein n=1 Tax=Rhipicephalus sanguineus TaxID=34632 RepID=A0A9D4PLF0_RHISA|nr:hypothetical protein HPB52_007477 [Rhipicephalus sanguineus]
MNEELRIRSSAESIRRRMSAVYSRKVRVVLVSSVLCIVVGLGALAVVVKKPEVLHEALALLGGTLQANGSSQVLGSPEPGRALVNVGTAPVSSPMTSERASSSIMKVGTTTLGSSPSYASATSGSTFASSTGTAITTVSSAETTSRGKVSGTPTTTAGMKTSREARALSLNATGTTGSTDKRASQKTTLSKLATSTFVSPSAQSHRSQKVSARSSVAPNTAYLVIDSDGLKEKMQMWPQMMRDIEAPEKNNVPPASEIGGEDAAGGSKLWYYIESTGGNSTSDDMDDEVFGEGDNTEGPHPPIS